MSENGPHVEARGDSPLMPAIVLAVWSNDNDFKDASVEWHTTAELLRP